MIYFLKSGDAVKIGYSANPGKRIKRFHTGNPYNLPVLGVMDGELSDEASLHERFAAHRIRPDREWFILCDEIVDFIETNCRPFLNKGRMASSAGSVNGDSRKDIVFLVAIYSWLIVVYPWTFLVINMMYRTDFAMNNSEKIAEASLIFLGSLVTSTATFIGRLIYLDNIEPYLNKRRYALIVEAAEQ
jgi:Meiotically up-regulated gene 113